MAIRVKLETKGLTKFLEQIAASAQNIDELVDDALKAGGEVLKAGMRRRVRKDSHNLEEHIDVEGPFNDGNQHFVTVGLKKSTDADTSRYGNAQEYGTSNMAAQSYIRATVDEDMGKARAAMKKVIMGSGK
jgi:HK97 gp10 family phage protein